MAGSAEKWHDADAYDRFMGRWSRPLAERFVAWVAVKPGGRAIDVGCGTGALTEALLRAGARQVTGADRSSSFVDGASGAFGGDQRVRFTEAEATSLGEPTGAFDVALSCLVANFVDDPGAMVREMSRVTRKSGTIGLCVWDYGRRMEMLRVFWDAAAELDPTGVATLDERTRFPLCEPGALGGLLRREGLANVRTEAIDLPMVFSSFGDYWEPFTRGSAPAQRYMLGLSDQSRVALQELLAKRVAPGVDGTISMVGRAWAAAGVRA